MLILSTHERASVHRRIAFLEARLRDLHLDDQLSAVEKLNQWRTLYAELKRLRETGASGRFITRKAAPTSTASA